MRLAALILSLIPALAPAEAAAAEFFTLKGHGGPVRDIAVAADGRIATAGFDTSVGLWRDRAPVWFEGHEAAVNAVTFAGAVAVSAGDDGTVRRWPEGRVIGRHAGKVVALAARPGLIASASWDGTVGLWPLDGGGTAVEAAAVKTAGRRIAAHRGGAGAVAFSPDGTVLWTAGKDGMLREWDVATGRERRRLARHGFAINRIAVARDGGWLAYGAADGAVRILDTAGGRVLHNLTLGRHPVLALAVSPAGDRLAIGDGQGHITIVDSRRWRILRDFRATLRGPVWALAFSPDGGNIHAGGLDSAVYSWPLDGAEGAIAPPPAGTGGADGGADDGAADEGARLFARRCAICHDLGPDGGRRAGPTLHRLFGRRAGTVAGYRYSPALRESNIVWTAESISALFDIGPDHYIPGTKMPMQRIADPAARAGLIDFLRRATAPRTDR